MSEIYYKSWIIIFFNFFDMDLCLIGIIFSDRKPLPNTSNYSLSVYRIKFNKLILALYIGDMLSKDYDASNFYNI